MVIEGPRTALILPGLSVEIEATRPVRVTTRTIGRISVAGLARMQDRTGHNPTELGSDSLAISAISPHLTKTRRNCPANPLIAWGIKSAAKFFECAQLRALDFFRAGSGRWTRLQTTVCR